MSGTWAANWAIAYIQSENKQGIAIELADNGYPSQCHLFHPKSHMDFRNNNPVPSL
jgi:hypothetical protein